MKRIALLWLLCVLIGGNMLPAQRPEGRESPGKVMQERKAFIAKEAGLDEAQLEAFTVFEREFRQERRKLMREKTGLPRPLQELSDEEIQNWLNLRLQKEEKRLELQRNHQQEGIRRFGLRTYASIIQADEKFKQQMIERLKSRKRKPE